MFTLGVLLVLCASAAGQTCNESPTCSLFPNQEHGVVTIQDLTEKVQSKSWIELYYADFTDADSYGKCKFKWNAPDTNGNVKRELKCYNFDLQGCEDWTRTLKRKASDCNRGEENSAISNQTMDAKFYSQDLDKYFWYDACYQYDSANKCTIRYLDLIVRRTVYSDLYHSDVDLKGLPWHLIASDLKYHFNMVLSDTRMKFSWRGPECGFDGKLMRTGSFETDSANQSRVNAIALFVIVATYSFISYM